MFRISIISVMVLASALAAGCKDEGDTLIIGAEPYTPPAWSFAFNVSDAASSSTRPAIAADAAGEAHISWLQGHSGSDQDIFYANSTSWATSVNISAMPFPSEAENSAIVVDAGGVVHVAWRQNVGGGNTEIYYANSTNWSAHTNLSSSSDFTRSPAIAAGIDGTIHVVWEQFVGGGSQSDIIYANSTSWATTANVTDTAEMSVDPSIVVDNSGVVRLAWAEYISALQYDIMLTDSTNWSAAVNATDTPYKSYEPDLAIDPWGTLHLVWQENVYGSYWQIHYAASSNWTQHTDISASFAVSQEPAIVVAPDGIVHIVWEEDRNFSLFDIYYASPAALYIEPVNLSKTPDDNSTRPDIAVGPDGVIHIAWSENVGSAAQIYYINSDR